MLKIGICDDDGKCIAKLKSYIERWAVRKGINIELYHFSSGEQLIEHIIAFGRYDLLFLDIEMQGMNGLQIAERIREKDYYTALILMSQYDTYFQEGYEVQPFYFFTKPIEEKLFIKVANKYLSMCQPTLENITFKSGKISYSVNLSEIIYFTSEKRIVHVIGINEVYSYYGKLDDVQELVNQKKYRFLRIHKSFLINMKYIKQYHYKNIIMSNGVKLPISVEYRRPMNEIHMLLGMEC